MLGLNNLVLLIISFMPGSRVVIIVSTEDFVFSTTREIILFPESHLNKPGPCGDVVGLVSTSISGTTIDLLASNGVICAPEIIGICFDGINTTVFQFYNGSSCHNPCVITSTNPIFSCN